MTWRRVRCFGLGAGVGFLLAIAGLAGIRKKLRYSDVPAGLRGLGMTFILTGTHGHWISGLFRN